MPRTRQIGIPRSIFHYETGGIFQRFFESLGLEVVVSPETSRLIFELGKQRMIDEFCFPLKAYAGHVLWLARAGIRPTFVPIITGSANNRSFLCHYQIRMRDIIRDLGLVGEGDVLSGVFTFDGCGLLDDGFYEAGRALGCTDETIADALVAARQRSLGQERAVPLGGAKTIGLLGHGYVTCDPWVSMDIRRKLADLGCRVITEDDVRGEEFYPPDLELHFALSARTLQAAREMNARPDVDGLVFQIPFNCGPDGDIAGQLVSESRKPLLTLVIDELTGQEGLMTRLEAFLDVISREPELHHA